MTDTQAAGVADTPGTRIARVRRAAIGAVFMLIIQFVLGIIYNLYGTAPESGKSIGWFSNGWLALHVILGILLILAGIGLVVQSVRTSSGLAKGLSVVGLVGIIAAFGSGADFASSGKAGSSLGMALAFAVALICYVVLLIRLPGES
ncbi:MAG TPA: hypothetical protein VFB06_22225 [Streptosporangiaceae bacterium]|nr:hypothetical protein [Streptosporangiaceae bacterium]